MFPPSNRRDLSTVYISKDSLPSLYNGTKSLKRKSCWRYWNRLSSLQRSLLCMTLLFGTLAGVYFLPNLYYSYKSIEELDNLSDNSNHHKDDRVVAPVGPEKDKKYSIKVQLEENIEQIDKAKNTNTVQRFDIKRGPPSLIDRKQKNELKVDIDTNLQQPIEKDAANIHLKYDGPLNEKQQAVVGAFKHSWNAYKKYAWGHDQLKPLSKSYEEWFGVGLTLLDALDTMYIMNLQDEFSEAREWIEKSLNFDVSRDVNLFECTIRVLGGLLSAYHLSKDILFLNKAKDVADRMMPAFNTNSGVPFSDVNLKTGKAHAPRWGPDSSTAEVTSIQLEFRDLSHITGDSKYKDAVDGVTQHIHKQPKKDGLVPIFINASTGRFRTSSTITLGARGDSYYEYLLKMWLQSGKTDVTVKQDYIEAIEGVKKHLLRESEPNKLLYIGELLGGRTFSPKMDHLVCYLGGTLALGAQNGLPAEHMEIGKKLTETCVEMYLRMPTGLSPEIVYFNTMEGGKEDIIVKPADTHNLERPETVESLFYLYRITGDPVYREWGWRIFQSFEKYTRLPEGYSAINNVKSPMNPGFRNKMESFWLGETLKYLFLLFSDDPNLIPLDKYVFNTEAHPLPIQSHG